MQTFDPDAFLAQPTAPGFDPDAFLAREERRDRLDSPLLAGAAGLARGATFGLSDVALTKSGLVNKDTLTGLREFNPTASLFGEIGGAVAPTLLSGGAGALGSAARLASAPVRAAATAGKLVENAALKALGSEVAKSSTRKILDGAAAKALGLGIEGSFYGAGQIVSEAALGDPKQAAEKALSTIGLSAILSGGLGGSLALAAPAMKGIASSIKPYVSKLRQNFVGVSPAVEKTVLQKADKIEALSQYGDDLDSIVVNAAQDKMLVANQARYQLIDDVTTEVNRLIQEGNLNGKTQSLKPLWDSINEARKKVAPSGKVATPELQRYVAQIDDLENRLMEYAGETAGLTPEATLLARNELIERGQLTPLQLNDLKKQYYRSADFNKQVGQTTPVEDLYNSLGKETNKLLDKVDENIRLQNMRLSSAIGSQQSLKNYGLYDRGSFDAAKFQKLISANDAKYLEAKPWLEELDRLWGTDLAESVELLRAYKQIYPKDMVARSFSGRSLLQPVLGGATGSLIGGPLGAAAGILGAAALQSPVATKARIGVADAVTNLLKSDVSNKLRSFGGKAGMFIPSNTAPIIAGQVSALATLERQQKYVDNKIDRAASAFTHRFAEPDEDIPSLDATRSTNFGKVGNRYEPDRIKAFHDRTRELSDIVNNPDRLTDMITNNLKQLSLVAPEIASNLAMHSVMAAQFLYSKAPKSPISDPYKPLSEAAWRPSDTELSKFERYMQAVDSPMASFKDFVAGRMTREQAETLQVLYPTIYNQFSQKVLERVQKQKKPLTQKQRHQLDVLFGKQVANLSRLQQNYGQAEPPSMGMKPVQMAGSKMTETQRIQGRNA